MVHICGYVFLHKIKYHLSVEKCVPTQNVMAACSFDMQFTFVWAGWEDNAHDIWIFLEAIYNPNIKFPKPPEGINKPKYVILFISRRGNFIFIIDK
jgi:hypothetical protein